MSAKDEGTVTEASMRAANAQPMQSKRLYAEQLVDAIVEVTLYKVKLEEVRRRPELRFSEAHMMGRYSAAREIAVQLVITEEAGGIF